MAVTLSQRGVVEGAVALIIVRRLDVRAAFQHHVAPFCVAKPSPLPVLPLLDRGRGLLGAHFQQDVESGERRKKWPENAGRV